MGEARPRGVVQRVNSESDEAVHGVERRVVAVEIVWQRSFVVRGAERCHSQASWSDVAMGFTQRSIGHEVSS